jgi:hypothetical protein
MSKSTLTFLFTISLYFVSNAQETPFSNNVGIKNGYNLYFEAASNTPTDAGDIVFRKFNGEENARIYTDPAAPNEIYFSYGPRIITSMMINSNGFVGIGTTTPKESLSVNGNIRARELKVETDNWPDYVFDKKYVLPDLSVVKAFTDRNRHLPEMPSEKKVAEEGVNVGEISKLLVKKVEELTLYLIEVKETNTQLTSKLALEEKRYITLEKRLKELENSIKLSNR